MRETAAKPTELMSESRKPAPLPNGDGSAEAVSHESTQPAEAEALHEPEEYSVSHKPTTGLAGYSYLGTLKLAEALQDILGYEVSIRHRCLVVASRWVDLPPDYHRNIEFIQKSEVQLWTREMMEPTISAILPTSLSPPDTNEIGKLYIPVPCD